MQIRVRAPLTMFAVLLLLVASSAASSAAGGSRKRAFRLVASGNVASVAAGGQWAFYVKNVFGPGPLGADQVVATVGTLLNERTGKRRVLHVPNCSQFGDELLGGPWLLVVCDSGTPGPLLYDLSTHRWTRVIVGATSQLPGGTCTSTIGNSCSFVALGRDWIEVESQAYHQANEYFIARIPTGAESGSRAKPGGRLAFDLDSSSGVQRLCSPLRYPEAPWTTADGTTAVQPGFMQVLGRFALVADGYVAPTSYRSARLERCGEHSAIQLPTTGIAISSRALAWWATGHVGGILLPSLKRFRLATPSGPINTEWPTMALSASRVYMVNSGKLWAAPLP